MECSCEPHFISGAQPIRDLTNCGRWRELNENAKRKCWSRFEGTTLYSEPLQWLHPHKTNDRSSQKHHGKGMRGLSAVTCAVNQEYKDTDKHQHRNEHMLSILSSCAWQDEKSIARLRACLLNDLETTFG